MPAGVPVPDEKRAEIITLIRAGGGRNQVAAESGVSTMTVSRIARDAGLTFDRAATRAATAARMADLAERRQELIDKLLCRADEFLEQMDQPFLVFNFGGKDNTYEEHHLDAPPTGDIKNLMTSVGIALQRAVELEKVGVADSVEGTKSMLTLVGERLGVADA